MIAVTQNIEQVILDYFEKSKKSIIIVVAWFTNERIVDKLVQLKQRKNRLSIEILIDDNETNHKYFFDLYSEKLIKAGICIKKQKIKKFNHNKFAIIDNRIIITGSYNYTQKANRNHENIIIDVNKRIANYYTRIFRFFTEEDYIDENVELLFEDFDFANKIISTYYPFSKSLFLKIKENVELGCCFTLENGLYDEISYEPGLIFNSKYIYHKELANAIEIKSNNDYSIDLIQSQFCQEFQLPISKETICNYRVCSFNDYLYSSYLDIAIDNKSEIDWRNLSKDFTITQKNLTKYYARKFEKIFGKLELKSIIMNNFDMIVEDYIWINNFAPFINDKIVQKIYNKNAENNHSFNHHATPSHRTGGINQLASPLGDLDISKQ